MNRNFIFVIGLILLFAVCGYSQSRMHYTHTANGDQPIVLFPEKNGETFITESIAIDSTINYIDDIEHLLLHIDSNKMYKVEDIKRAHNSLSCRIEIECGNQPWEITVFGSPVISFNRNATKVKMHCMFTEKNGKGYFKFDNFETNRNTLRGEAKNDGDPNIIQWQRVNSLLKERDSECDNLSNKNNAEKLFYYNSQIATECRLYCMEWNLTNAIIEAIENIGTGEPVEFDCTHPNPIYFYFDINELGNPNVFDNIKDRFIKKDCKTIPSLKSDNLIPSPLVYVSSGIHDYEKAGKAAIEAQIIINKLARITFDKENADFIIDYTVDTEGRDKAILTIYNINGEIIASKKKGSNESISDNREVAKSLYKSVVVKVLNR